MADHLFAWEGSDSHALIWCTCTRINICAYIVFYDQMNVDMTPHRIRSEPIAQHLRDLALVVGLNVNGSWNGSSIELGHLFDAHHTIDRAHRRHGNIITSLVSVSYSIESTIILLHLRASLQRSKRIHGSVWPTCAAALKTRLMKHWYLSRSAHQT